MRLKIMRALVNDDLEIIRSISPPDSAFNYDWSVLDRFMGKSASQMYFLKGLGFKLDHQVPDADLQAFTAFKDFWSNLDIAPPILQIFTTTAKGLRKRESKRISKDQRKLKSPSS